MEMLPFRLQENMLLAFYILFVKYKVIVEPYILLKIYKE